MMLHKVVSDFHPDYLVVCFDTPKPTFRQEMMKEYQAQRPHATEDFKIQIPYIRDLLDKAGIARMEMDGYEADDVIGSIATKFKSKDVKVYILTGDKDIMQLVDENVSVIAPKIGLSSVIIYTPEEVIKKLGVKAEQIPDYKALAGDPSDNYIGIRGIGPKTAAKLIEKYISIETLIEKIDQIPEEKIKLLLKTHIEELIKTKKIATIVKDIPVANSLDEYSFTSFKAAMKDALITLQFNGLLRKIFPDHIIEEVKKVEKKVKQEKIDDPQPGLF